MPVKKKVSHSTAYYKKIKEWARTGTVDLARNLNTSQYASYEVGINYWVENNLTPEAILRAEEKQERDEEKKTASGNKAQ